MKLYVPILMLSFFFNYSSAAWAIPLYDLQQNEEFLIKPPELKSRLDTTQSKDENTLISQNNKTSGEGVLASSLMQETFVNKTEGSAYSPDDKQVSGGDVSAFYLFEQEELDAQKPALGIYETLAPILSAEMKNDVKKIWADTVDFRNAIIFSSKDSGSKELILQQSSREINLQPSSKEMSQLKWKTVGGLSNNNLSAGANDRKTPDQVVIKELFDGIFDLIRNAFFIIAGILIVGKIVSLIVIKIMSQRKKRKRKKRKRKSSRRRRKRRRRTLSALN